MFDKASFDNRDTIYESIDVEFLATGTGASSAINVFRPTVLNGYITTLFAQQGINVSRTTACCLRLQQYEPMPQRLHMCFSAATQYKCRCCQLAAC